MSGWAACPAEPTRANRTWRSWEQSPSQLQPVTWLFGIKRFLTAVGRIEASVRASFITSRWFQLEARRKGIGSNEPAGLAGGRVSVQAMRELGFKNQIAARIAMFLMEIGIPVEASAFQENTVLPV